MTRLSTVIAVALLLSSCAKPYMTAKDCADLCQAQGKNVESYIVGAQIPIVLPRPNTKCACEDSADE